MAKLRVAYEYTEAEDKSIRLGLFLIISGVVSLFIFGFCWLSPALQALQATAVNCTVLSVQQIGEVFECTFTCGADCRGTSQYPCVQVYVNNSESNSRALLHSDEHQLLTNPKCSYIPPCKRENQKNLENVMNWQQYWKDEIGSQPFTCYFNQFQRLVTGQNNQNLLLRIGSVSELGRERVSTCVETEASWWDVVDQPEGPATRHGVL
nr:calcium-activated potassium channel subunit beta-4 isoform X4 [Manis javanica]